MLKSLKEKYLELNKGERVQLILAVILTLALIPSIITYAWFALSDGLETLTKVKEPENMDIRAGGAQPDPIVNFDLSDIDITKVQENPQMRVFTVSPGDYKMRYKLQLAYTTNIPFTYKIYKATDATANSYDVAYLKKGDKEEKTLYYSKGEQIGMDKKNVIANPSYYGRDLGESDAENHYYENTYESNDTPELYAVPIYEQSMSAITPGNNANGYDYYILEISWNPEGSTTNFTEWNEAANKKETDMIYITATITGN